MSAQPPTTDALSCMATTRQFSVKTLSFTTESESEPEPEYFIDPPGHIAWDS